MSFADHNSRIGSVIARSGGDDPERRRPDALRTAQNALDVAKSKLSELRPAYDSARSRVAKASVLYNHFYDDPEKGPDAETLLHEAEDQMLGVQHRWDVAVDAESSAAALVAQARQENRRRKSPLSRVGGMVAKSLLHAYGFGHVDQHRHAYDMSPHVNPTMRVLGTMAEHFGMGSEFHTAAGADPYLTHRRSTSMGRRGHGGDGGEHQHMWGDDSNEALRANLRSASARARGRSRDSDQERRRREHGKRQDQRAEDTEHRRKAKQTDTDKRKAERQEETDRRRAERETQRATGRGGRSGAKPAGRYTEHPAATPGLLGIAPPDKLDAASNGGPDAPSAPPVNPSPAPKPSSPKSGGGNAGANSGSVLRAIEALTMAIQANVDADERRHRELISAVEWNQTSPAGPAASAPSSTPPAPPTSSAAVVGDSVPVVEEPEAEPESVVENTTKPAGKSRRKAPARPVIEADEGEESPNYEVRRNKAIQEEARRAAEGFLAPDAPVKPSKAQAGPTLPVEEPKAVPLPAGNFEQSVSDRKFERGTEQAGGKTRLFHKIDGRRVAGSAFKSAWTEANTQESKPTAAPRSRTRPQAPAAAQAPMIFPDGAEIRTVTPTISDVVHTAAKSDRSGDRARPTRAAERMARRSATFSTAATSVKAADAAPNEALSAGATTPAPPPALAIAPSAPAPLTTPASLQPGPSKYIPLGSDGSGTTIPSAGSVGVAVQGMHAVLNELRKLTTDFKKAHELDVAWRETQADIDAKHHEELIASLEGEAAQRNTPHVGGSEAASPGGGGGHGGDEGGGGGFDLPGLPDKSDRQRGKTGEPGHGPEKPRARKGFRGRIASTLEKAREFSRGRGGRFALLGALGIGAYETLQYLHEQMSGASPDGDYAPTGAEAGAAEAAPTVPAVDAGAGPAAGPAPARAAGAVDPASLTPPTLSPAELAPVARLAAGMQPTAPSSPAPGVAGSAPALPTVKPKPEERVVAKTRWGDAIHEGDRAAGKGLGRWMAKSFGGAAAGTLSVVSGYQDLQDLYGLYAQNKISRDDFKHRFVELLTSTVGGTAGAYIGELLGGVMGSVLGPIGTAVGAGAGGMVGGWVGSQIGGSAGSTDLARRILDPAAEFAAPSEAAELAGAAAHGDVTEIPTLTVHPDSPSAPNATSSAPSAPARPVSAPASANRPVTNSAPRALPNAPAVSGQHVSNSIHMDQARSAPAASNPVAPTVSPAAGEHVSNSVHMDRPGSTPVPSTPATTSVAPRSVEQRQQSAPETNQRVTDVARTSYEAAHGVNSWLSLSHHERSKLTARAAQAAPGIPGQHVSTMAPTDHPGSTQDPTFPQDASPIQGDSFPTAMHTGSPDSTQALSVPRAMSPTQGERVSALAHTDQRDSTQDSGFPNSTLPAQDDYVPALARTGNSDRAPAPSVPHDASPVQGEQFAAGVSTGVADSALVPTFSREASPLQDEPVSAGLRAGHSNSAPAPSAPHNASPVQAEQLSAGVDAGHADRASVPSVPHDASPIQGEHVSAGVRAGHFDNPPTPIVPHDASPVQGEHFSAARTGQPDSAQAPIIPNNAPSAQGGRVPAGVAARHLDKAPAPNVPHAASPVQGEHILAAVRTSHPGSASVPRPLHEASPIQGEHVSAAVHTRHPDSTQTPSVPHDASPIQGEHVSAAVHTGQPNRTQAPSAPNNLPSVQGEPAPAEARARSSDSSPTQSIPNNKPLVQGEHVVATVHVGHSDSAPAPVPSVLATNPAVPSVSPAMQGEHVSTLVHPDHPGSPSTPSAPSTVPVAPQSVEQRQQVAAETHRRVTETARTSYEAAHGVNSWLALSHHERAKLTTRVAQAQTGVPAQPTSATVSTSGLQIPVSQPASARSQEDTVETRAAAEYTRLHRDRLTGKQSAASWHALPPEIRRGMVEGQRNRDAIDAERTRVREPAFQGDFGPRKLPTVPPAAPIEVHRAGNLPVNSPPPPVEVRHAGNVPVMPGPSGGLTGRALNEQPTAGIIIAGAGRDVTRPSGYSDGAEGSAPPAGPVPSGGGTAVREPNEPSPVPSTPGTGDIRQANTPAMVSPGGADRPAAPFVGRTFSDKAPQIMQRLQQDLNLTPAQAAGVMGNLGHESGGLTQMQERNPTVAGSRGGLGWAQWTGPRRRAYEAFCAEKGISPTSDEANYGFLKKELQTTHKSALTQLRKTTTVEDATTTFEKHFEGAGIKHMESRQNYARQAMAAAQRAPASTQVAEAGRSPSAAGVTAGRSPGAAAAGTQPGGGPAASGQAPSDADGVPPGITQARSSATVAASVQPPGAAAAGGQPGGAPSASGQAPSDADGVPPGLTQARSSATVAAGAQPPGAAAAGGQPGEGPVAPRQASSDADGVPPGLTQARSSATVAAGAQPGVAAAGGQPGEGPVAPRQASSDAGGVPPGLTQARSSATVAAGAQPGVAAAGGQPGEGPVAPRQASSDAGGVPPGLTQARSSATVAAGAQPGVAAAGGQPGEGPVAPRQASSDAGGVPPGLTQARSSATVAAGAQPGGMRPSPGQGGGDADYANTLRAKYLSQNGAVRAPGGQAQCVDLGRDVGGLGHTGEWKAGASATGALAAGTSIATFDPNGKYGNHSDGRSHTAVVLGPAPGGGVRIMEQWAGHKPRERVLGENGNRPMDKLSSYRVVEGAAGSQTARARATQLAQQQERGGGQGAPAAATEGQPEQPPQIADAGAGAGEGGQGSTPNAPVRVSANLSPATMSDAGGNAGLGLDGPATEASPQAGQNADVIMSGMGGGRDQITPPQAPVAAANPVASIAERLFPNVGSNAIRNIGGSVARPTPMFQGSGIPGLAASSLPQMMAGLGAPGGFSGMLARGRPLATSMLPPSMASVGAAVAQTAFGSPSAAPVRASQAAPEDIPAIADAQRSRGNDSASASSGGSGGSSEGDGGGLGGSVPMGNFLGSGGGGGGSGGGGGGGGEGSKSGGGMNSSPTRSDELSPMLFALNAGFFS